ncbi:hypothetical protein BKA93DRAFT_328991 [Sparassis latifolia]
MLCVFLLLFVHYLLPPRLFRIVLSSCNCLTPSSRCAPPLASLSICIICTRLTRCSVRWPLPRLSAPSTSRMDLVVLVVSNNCPIIAIHRTSSRQSFFTPFALVCICEQLTLQVSIDEFPLEPCMLSHPVR